MRLLDSISRDCNPGEVLYGEVLENSSVHIEIFSSYLILMGLRAGCFVRTLICFRCRNVDQIKKLSNRLQLQADRTLIENLCVAMR